MSISSIFIFLSLLSTSTNAATFEVRNNCPYTVWAAATPGGGQQLNQGQVWAFEVANGTRSGRIWGRTKCDFGELSDAPKGCETGDCGGLLDCQGSGRPPNTVVEYALNQFSNSDFFDISLVNGFNIPVDFSPITGGCRGTKCTADIKGECPDELRVSGGCNNPCTVFNTDTCGPISYSKFFKDRCPEAYSYPKDDQTSTFTCPGGTNYRVEFCPDPGPTFLVQNQCPYTVWAAAVPGGGQELDQGQNWTFSVEPYTILGRIWGRTNCTFDADDSGKCETGDCGGRLQCESGGAPPVTVAEYALNQFNGLDFFDITLLDGFNVPMGFNPTTGTGCGGVNCTTDIRVECPAELLVPGGCNDPCSVFKTDEYCCKSGKCGPTSYSKFFKERCPDAYSYPMDDTNSTFSCPAGTRYKVLFCP